MSLIDLKKEKSGAVKNLHSAYTKGFFSLNPKVQYSKGEMISAALYRNIGFGITDSKIIKNFKSIKPNIASDNKLKHLVEILETPRTPEMPSYTSPTAKEFNTPSFTPVEPNLALYSSKPAGPRPWAIHELIPYIFSLSGPYEEVSKVWSDLFDSLSISKEDDVWAHYIKYVMEENKPNEVENNWSLNNLNKERFILPNNEIEKITSPATTLLNDIKYIIKLKDQLTRRQWISVLEVILRLGSSAHFMWLCHVNSIVWKKIKDSYIKSLKFQLSEEDISTPDNEFWTYNLPVNKATKDHLKSYFKAKIGINYFLYWLEDKKNIQISNDIFCSIENTNHFFCSNKIDKSSWFSFFDEYQEFIGSFELNAGKNESGSDLNQIWEFIDHTIRQRAVSDPDFRTYDQSYFSKKRGNSGNQPFIFSFGPVSIMTLVHCCTKGTYHTNILKFCDYLSKYGIKITPNNIKNNDLGTMMKDLGLIFVSPDAEGGMMINSPFDDK